MPRGDNWWARQFVERLKGITQIYDRFCLIREIKDFDATNMLHEELNQAYDMSCDMLDFVEFGRALPGKHALPIFGRLL